MSIPFLACMAAAASFYHLPPRVLPAIQAVEGGRPGLIQPNANGTADLGLMQINSIWIEPLARFANMPAQVVAYRLVDDPCFNIAAAAAIMRAYLSEAQGNLMIAIGFYHSHTPGFGAIYQQKVLGAAATLFSGKRHQTR
jgi:Transglycosylase SLT domain